jgi:hypothetical protein
MWPSDVLERSEPPSVKVDNQDHSAADKNGSGRQGPDITASDKSEELEVRQ